MTRKSKGGSFGFTLGRVNEARVCDAINGRVATVPWITGARLATPEEDSRGIDVVVKLVGMRMYLQVKSSRGMAKAWAKKAAHTPDRQHILVVVVDRTFTPDSIIALLSDERERRKAGGASAGSCRRGV